MDLNGKRGLSIIVFDERRHYLSCTKKWSDFELFWPQNPLNKDDKEDENIYFLKVSIVIPFWNHKPKPI